MYITFITLMIISIAILLGASVAKIFFKQNINLADLIKSIILVLVISMAIEFAYILILRSLHKIQQLYTAPILTILIFISILVVMLSKRKN